VLRDFFLGKVSAAALARDISGSLVRISKKIWEVRIIDMDSDMVVERPMLVTVCDAILAGQMPPEHLKIIGFALSASDHFVWDGDKDDVLANVIADWSAPEINYPLTNENVRRFRRWLTAEEPYPDRPPAAKSLDGEVYETVYKKSIKHWPL
jgi:hypothetical protein